MTQPSEWALEKARVCVGDIVEEVGGPYAGHAQEIRDGKRDGEYEDEITRTARALMEAEKRGEAREREAIAQWHDQRAFQLRQLGLFHAQSLAAEHENSATTIRARGGENG